AVRNIFCKRGSALDRAPTENAESVCHAFLLRVTFRAQILDDVEKIGAVFGLFNADDPVVNLFRTLDEAAECENLHDNRETLLRARAAGRADTQEFAHRLCASIQGRSYMHPAFVHFIEIYVAR